MTDPVSYAIKFVILALATWRVTHLLANEDGPANIITRIRMRLGESILGRLMDCFNCLSLWIAAPAALYLGRGYLFWVVNWWGLSGAACLLERFTPSHEEIRIPADAGEEERQCAVVEIAKR